MCAPNGSAAELIPAAATLAVMVGALLVLAAACSVSGFVANFISEPVLTGFKSGIGLVIVVDQIPKLLGIHITKAGFFRDLLSIVHGFLTLAGRRSCSRLLLLALIFAFEHFAPRAPAPLIAIAAGDCRVGPAGPQSLGRGDDRSGRRRPSVTGSSTARARRGDVAGGNRHCPHELHREHCRGTRVRRAGRAAAVAQPRARRDRRRQPRRRTVRRDACRRRDVPDGGQPEGRRPNRSSRRS